VLRLLGPPSPTLRAITCQLDTATRLKVSQAEGKSWEGDTHSSYCPRQRTCAFGPSEVPPRFLSIHDSKLSKNSIAESRVGVDPKRLARYTRGFGDAGYGCVWQTSLTKMRGGGDGGDHAAGWKSKPPRTRRGAQGTAGGSRRGFVTIVSRFETLHAPTSAVRRTRRRPGALVNPRNLRSAATARAPHGGAHLPPASPWDVRQG
jgi:hypothetical protein